MGSLGRHAGHHSGKVLIAAVPAAASLNWLNQTRPSLVPPLGISLAVVVIGAWLAMRQHDRSLCELCAAGLPLAPAADAERYGNRLRVVHLLSRPRISAAYLAAIAATYFLMTSTIGILVWAAAQSTLAYLVLAHTTHRRLQPWCPECGEGGPGLTEHTPHTPITPAA